MIGDLVVEVDGEYWHGTPRQKRRDKRKDGFLKSRGYRVLRVPASDVLRDPDEVAARIREQVR